MFGEVYNKFFLSKRQQQNNDTDSDVSNNVIYLKIPFIGPASTKFAKSVSTIFEETFDLKITLVFYAFKEKSYD